MSLPMKAVEQGDVMEQVLLKGDIGKLTADERVRYYSEVCRSMGLNPLTKPFEFITLNGKLQLYALRACTDQLRKINNISLEIVSREVANEILTIHVRATTDGRSDEDLGAVPFPDSLKGEARVNAELKAVTKAKRRATLSICGLGWLDETEIETIPASAKQPTSSQHTMTMLEDRVIPHIPDAAPLTAEDYGKRWDKIVANTTDGEELAKLWNDEKATRDKINWPAGSFGPIKKKVADAIDFLRDPVS